MNSANRVLITGVGVVCPIGLSAEETWQRIRLQQNSITPIGFGHGCDFRIETASFVDCEKIRRNIKPEHIGYSKSFQYGLVALQEAIEKARLTPGDMQNTRIILSTTSSGWDVLERRLGEKELGEFNIQETAGWCASKLKEISGSIRPTSTFAAACASGTIALGYAYDLISTGCEDIVLVGGVDVLTKVPFALFDSLRVLSARECRPFDSKSSGIVLSEGAAFIVLESEHSAKQRGISSLVEFAGYGQACDASHMTRPSGEGLLEAMKQALNNAGVDSSSIDYINAHGTGTPSNDNVELGAIEKLMASRTSPIVVTSTKSSIGHLQGVAGVIEAAVVAYTVSENTVPPMKHSETRKNTNTISFDPKSDGLQNIGYAMSNSMGFGGVNAVAIFRRIDNGEISTLESCPRRGFMPISVRFGTENGGGGSIEDGFLGAYSFDRNGPDLQSKALISQVESILRHSDIAPKSLLRTRTGLALETCLGSIAVTEKIYADLDREGASGVDPIDATRNTFNAPGSFSAIASNLQGPNITLAAEMGSSLSALEYGISILQGNSSDLMIVGGYDYIPVESKTFKSIRMLGNEVAGGLGNCVFEASMMSIELLDSARKRGAQSDLVIEDFFRNSRRASMNAVVDVIATISEYLTENRIHQIGIECVINSKEGEAKWRKELDASGLKDKFQLNVEVLSSISPAWAYKYLKNLGGSSSKENDLDGNNRLDKYLVVFAGWNSEISVLRLGKVA